MNIARDHGYYCDCTLGGGGHLEKLLQMTRHARFVGIDWDPDAIAYSRQRLLPYAERLSLCQENYVNLDLILDRLKIDEIDGAIFDLGVSYHQLAADQRGFSFDRDCPLMMNMTPEKPSLIQRLEQADKFKIMEVLRSYGDVRNHRRIGSAIFENRKQLKSTGDLRELVVINTPRRFQVKNLRRVFQALRIWVNDELENVATGLVEAFDRLSTSGRLLAIAYHSGEDRIVKQQFRKWHQQGRGKLIHKKALRPGAAEVSDNPRSRSARLRVVEKCV